MPILWENLVKQFVDGLEESSEYFLQDEKSTSTKKQSAIEKSHAISCNLIKQEKLRRTKKVIGISCRFIANPVTCQDHYAMTISQQTLRKERSLSVYFMTYFVVILIKNFTFHASTSLLSFVIKLRRRSVDLSPKSFFWSSKQPFAIYFLLTSCNVCPVAISEIFAQTQGSYYWQLIHY